MLATNLELVDLSCLNWPDSCNRTPLFLISLSGQQLPYGHSQLDQMFISFLLRPSLSSQPPNLITATLWAALQSLFLALSRIRIDVSCGALRGIVLWILVYSSSGILQNVLGVRVKVLVHLGQSVEETGKEFLNIKLICIHSQNVLSEMDGVEPCLWSQERESWVFFIF